MALPGSGRDATTAFLAGTGDVLISYENEAILARQQGERPRLHRPRRDAADREPRRGHRRTPNPRAKAFLDFVLSDAGQTEYVKKGFRPLNNAVTGVEVEGANDPANPFPDADQAADDRQRLRWLDGGEHKFFDADTGIVTLIQQETGKTS